MPLDGALQAALAGGGQEAPQGLPDMTLAMLLAFLIERITNARREDPHLDPREINAREIPVRPRVEPLGGA